MNFYSARLLYIVLVDDRPCKSHTWEETVVVFRARDWIHAFARALDVGHSHEIEYLNHKQQKVRWALVEIEHLELVGKRVDGQEVMYRLRTRRSKKVIPFNAKFHPENSPPPQTYY